MSLLIQILVFIAIVVVAIFVIRKFQAGKAMKTGGVQRIYSAFRDMQATVLHSSGVDMEEINEFVMAMDQKNELFKNDKPMLEFIEEYYKQCVDLQRKCQRLKSAQSEEERKHVEQSRQASVNWFKGQNQFIVHHFSRYLKR